VKVDRPGLIVRARRGYVATPRATPAPTVTEARTASPLPAATAGTEPAALEKTDKTESTVADAGATAPAGGDAVVVPAERAAGNTARLRPNVTLHLNDLAVTEGPDKDATTGWEAYQRGDLATARTFLATAASRRGAQLWVQYALGQSEYALREYPDAVAAWERVHGGAPEFEPVYFDLVDGYLQLKEYDKAVRLLRSATERWPRDPETFNALGVVQTARGSLDDAVKSFGQAVAVAPGDAVGYFNLGKAMELRYYRSRHYVQQLRSWVANENDRSGAIEHYERYLTLGGPYADAARAGLTRLSWTPK
jgi:tetratricopeptide (TPR) repeat protein